MNDEIWDSEDDPDEGALNADHPYWCAFCGEENSVFVDSSGSRRQKFTEDCAVCCRPNLITITIERTGAVNIEVEREYDA